jgi:hypothetical protein
LCGIARHLIGSALRRRGREPAHAAEALEEALELPSPEPMPAERAISREEESILWRSLERMAETYREPLVLFYREGQSVASVAQALELSEEVVKQRLSRGRRLLQAEVALFVEGALKQSAPGRAFTLSVLAALPLFTASASAATAGAMAAKGSAAVKAAASVGLFSAIVGPILSLVGIYFAYQMDREGARTPQRRVFISKAYRILVASYAALGLAVLVLALGGPTLADSRLSAGLWIGLGAMSGLVCLGFIGWVFGQRRRFHRGESSGKVLLTTPAEGSRPVPVFEYRSRLSLLGWPLVHIRLRAGLERGPVKAWIAGGDAAIGIIFAFGALAVAPLSFGGLAAGLVPFGGLAVGLAPLGAFSFGAWAMGGFVVGWQAFGGCALAWSAAQGGVAVAHDFALAGVALAQSANDAAAEVFIRNSAFFQRAMAAVPYAYWLYLVWLLPLALWWRTRRMASRCRSL